MKKIMVLFLILALCLTALPVMAEETTFKLDKNYNTVFVGETLQLVLNRTGNALDEGELTFTSANNKRATVDENGLVTGLAKGEVTITARLKTEKRTYKATLTVKVAVRATEISVTENKLDLYQPQDVKVSELLQEETQLPVLVLPMGKQLTLQATALPKEASNRKVTLTTSDEEIVRVRGSVLTPKAVGECTLTIASQQNPEIIKEYRLLVVQPITRLKVEAAEKSLYAGSTLKLTPVYTPENASIQAVTWSSSNEKIAMVDENGTVTGVSKGQVNIKATAADGSGRSTTIQLTVKQKAESITLKEDSFVLNVGKVKTMQATVLPRDTNDKGVSWFSSNAAVAKVNDSGRVTAVSPGTCVITCRSKSVPTVLATAMVEVHQPVERVSFTDREVAFNIHETCQLFWQVSPANATNQAVTFSSNNTKIATVDENGLVTGHKRGECTITVTAADGSKKRGTIKVKVLQPVEGVHMQNDTLRVGVDEDLTARAVLEPSDASNTRMSWSSADTSIATVRGNYTKPTITGKRWGTTTITGVTQDGGYTTTATVNVGNYDKALKVTDLYLSGNKIKINVNNESNMTISRFTFVIECYDIFDAPLMCNTNGSHAFYGSYSLDLYEGDTTEHGRFYFGDYQQPDQPIGRVVMRITGYSTDTGYSRDIRTDRQTAVEFTSATYVGATPTPIPEVTPPAAP